MIERKKNHSKIAFAKIPERVFGVGLFLILFFGLRQYSTAQEKYGLNTTNFGGINSAQLNPASTINSKLFLDINLASGGFFLENNFIFIHKEDYNLLNLLRKHPITPSDTLKGHGLDFDEKVEKVFAYQNFFVMGPSFSMATKKVAFGIFSKAMQVTSVDELPINIAILLYKGLKYDTTFYDVRNMNDKFEAVTMGWGELGVNFSFILSEYRKNRWSAGINVRRLFGFGGAFVKNNAIDYTLINDKTIDIKNINTVSGFSLPFDYTKNEFPDDENIFKVRGMAADVGIMFEKKTVYVVNRHNIRACSYEYEDYVYRFGLSLLDLGNIKFTENAQVHRFTDVKNYWDNIDDLTFENLNSFFDKLSQEFLYNPKASLKANFFTVELPTALSFQADYQPYQNWFVNTTFIFPLKTSDVQLKRPRQAIASFRYESRWFEIGLPFSYYDFKQPRLGLFARYYFLTIGTEKIGGFFNFSDFTGLDFYFSIKYNILKGDCNRYKPLPDCRHLSF